MSTSRGSSAAVVQPIPAGSRKVVQSLKEIVNCPEAEIYAALKECNMDPNEAVNRLLSQDPFHEVKSKREKKKESKDNSEPKSRGATNSSNRGNKSGADRHLGGHGASASYYTSDPPLHGRSAYKKESGSGPHTSSVSGASGNNRSWGHPGLIDDDHAGSKGSLLGATNGMSAAAQPASGHQPAWVGVPGQVSMADIVRRGKPNKKGSNAPNASHHSVDWPIDDAHKIHQSNVSSGPTKDEWPSIEKPPAAANVVLVPEHSVDPKLHAEASGGVSYDNINYHIKAEEVQEEEDDNFEISGGNDVGSVSISNRMIPEDDSRGASLFENELYKNTGSYQSDAHNSERLEVDDFGASVAPVTRNLQQLSVNTDDRECEPEDNAPSVVIPDHLQVQAADCSHLSFGSFGSFGAQTSVLEKPNSEEAHDEADNLSSGHPETRDSEYYVDDSLRNTPDGSLLHRNGAGGAGSYEASSAPQAEELRPDSADVAQGNQYPFPSANAGYSFDDAQRLNATFNLGTNSQMQNPQHLAQFSNVMHSYTNSLPNSLLAATVHHSKESDPQYSQFPGAQSMAAKYGNSVSSQTSMSEALKTTGLPSSQLAPQSLSGTNVATGPPLPQHLAVHPYSQPTLPLGPFANMIGYPFLPQSYTYMPSAFQQSFAGSSNYHQSLAAIPPQYKSSVSVSSLPPQSAAVNSGYGAFANNTAIPGNYSMNPPAAGPPSGTSLSYDDVLSSQYKDSSHLLSLQQNENSAAWLHGPNSRTMPAVPASAYYNYQTQNQQPGSFRQAQQQSQNYGSPAGYQNYYHPQAGISLDQQQNPRDGPLGGSQGQSKHSQIWPNY